MIRLRRRVNLTRPSAMQFRVAWIPATRLVSFGRMQTGRKPLAFFTYGPLL